VTRRAAPVVVLLGAEAGAVALLYRLARVDGLAGPGDDPVGWLRSAAPEEVVAGGLRLVALACAWWLLASTVLYLLARVSRVPVAVRAARLTVVPHIRRRIDRVLAVSVLSASVATVAAGSGPAAAGEPPPTTTSAPLVIEQDHRPPPDDPPPAPTVRDGHTVEELPSDAAAPAPTVPEPAEPPTSAPPPSPPPAPDAPAGGYVVAVGDNFWTIAASHLARTTGRDLATLTDAEIVAYWGKLVAVNDPTLRSGDPDFIYPGEAIELPPLE